MTIQPPPPANSGSVPDPVFDSNEPSTISERFPDALPVATIRPTLTESSQEQPPVGTLKLNNQAKKHVIVTNQSHNTYEVKEVTEDESLQLIRYRRAEFTIDLPRQVEGVVYEVRPALFNQAQHTSTAHSEFDPLRVVFDLLDISTIPFKTSQQSLTHGSVTSPPPPGRYALANIQNTSSLVQIEIRLFALPSFFPGAHPSPSSSSTSSSTSSSGFRSGPTDSSSDFGAALL